MDPRVRNLYKRFIVAGRDYPLGIDFVKPKVKKAFFDNAHLVDPIEINKKIAYGRWWAKELHAVNQFKKYRFLKRNY